MLVTSNLAFVVCGLSGSCPRATIGTTNNAARTMVFLTPLECAHTLFRCNPGMAEMGTAGDRGCRTSVASLDQRQIERGRLALG